MLQAIYKFNTIHYLFSVAVLAGSGSGRKGGKAVNVQAVSWVRSRRKAANSDVENESSSAGKFLYQW